MTQRERTCRRMRLHPIAGLVGIPVILAVIGSISLLAAAAPAQESHPAEGGGADPLEPRLMRLRAVLEDGSRRLEASHGQQGSQDYPLAGAEVTIETWSPEGEEEELPALSAGDGLIDVDLGLRLPGAPYVLRAKVGDVDYLSREAALGIELPDRITLYRVRHDHAPILQNVIRIVTGVGKTEEGELPEQLQVRQIIFVQNSSFDVYLGPPGVEGAAYLYPAPPGSTVSSLLVNGEAAISRQVREIEHWGHGVPIEEPLFPLARVQLMGTYVFPVEEGDDVDLGFEALVDTQRYQLALEQGILHHDPKKSGDGPRMIDKGPMGAGEMPRPVNTWELADIPAHTRVFVPVSFGAPGIAASTVILTAVIVGIVVLGLLGGIWLGSSRRGGRSSLAVGPVRPVELDRLYARGQISEEEYRREKEKLERSGTVAGREAPRREEPPPRRAGAEMEELLASLERIAERPGASPEELERDLKTLARVVRDHLLETRR
ncbi:MAG: hypothetical protein ACE5GW_11845 [Planctomycetota bacterium]